MDRERETLDWLQLRTHSEFSTRKGLVKRLTEGRDKLDRAVKGLRERVREAERVEAENRQKTRCVQVTTGEKRKLHVRSVSEQVQIIRSDTDLLLKKSQSKKRKEVQLMHGDEKLLKDLIIRQGKTLVSLQPVKQELR